MAESITAQLRNLELSDIEEEQPDKPAADESGPAFAFSVVNVISGARFADFSLERFVAATGAEPGTTFPAATLRTQNRGVFCVFRTGRIVHTGLRNEADAHRAIEDLARELKYTLAEPPHTDCVVYDVPMHCPVDLIILARLTPAHRTADGALSFRLRVGLRCVEVVANAAGNMRIVGVRNTTELRKATALLQHYVEACSALGGIENDWEEQEE